MPKTNNYIEIAVGVWRVANYIEYISQFARWPYYNLELIYMFHKPDRIEKFLRRNYPEHVHGYRMGWLDVEEVQAFGRKCYHIFTNSERGRKIIGTVI